MGVYSEDESLELTLTKREASRAAKMLIVSLIRNNGMGESQKYIGSQGEEAVLLALKKEADRLASLLGDQCFFGSFDECMLYGKGEKIS